MNYNAYSTDFLEELKQSHIDNDEFEEAIEIMKVIDARNNGEITPFLYATEMQAVDFTDGRIKTFMLMYIQAFSFEEAESICRKKYPYLKVTGKLIGEMDADSGELVEFN